MSFLEELCALVTACGLPLETGIFSGEAPDEYIVITPLADTFEFYARNCLQDEKHCEFLSLYALRTYIKRKNAVVRAGKARALPLPRGIMSDMRMTAVITSPMELAAYKDAYWRLCSRVLSGIWRE